METQPSNTLSPSLGLALALDSFSEQILVDLYQQHMAGNRAYQNIRLLALRKQDQIYRLVSLETEPASDLSLGSSQTVDDYGDQRRQAYQSLIDNAASLRQSLEISLHELRAHPRLLQSGLAYHLLVNLNIFLIGDLTNPHTSGLLFPLLTILQDLLANEPYCTLASLLRVALFQQKGTTGSEDPESARVFRQAAAGLHVALAELDSFLKTSESGLFRRVAIDLGLPDCETTPHQIFLFDRRKEGSLMVQDEQELSLIMGNFCLALLSGDLSQKLSGSGAYDRAGFNPLYNSAAASALLYQPEPLIQACAAWLGISFLTGAIPEEKSPNLALVTELTTKILPVLGTLPEWLDQGCQGLPFQRSQDEARPGLAMHLDGPGFENTQPSEWENLLRQYCERLFEVELPLYCESFLEQFNLFQSARLDGLRSWLQSFVQDGLAIGAGFSTLMQAAQAVEGQTSLNMQSLQDLSAARSRLTTAELESAFESLANLVARPPYRPSLRSLRQTFREAIAAQQAKPRRIHNLRSWLSEIIVRWLRRGELQLIAGRETCLHTIELALVDRFIEVILADLHAASESLQGLLVQSYEDIDNLEETYRLAQAQLEVHAREVQNHLFSPAPLFRPEVITPAVFRWAREHWKPGWEEMRIALIHQSGWLSDWRQLSPEALLQRLLAYCRMIYAPGLAHLSLSEVFDHSDTRLPQVIPAAMIAGSIPLLRANFDRLGGGATAWEIHGLQTFDRQPETIQTLAAQTALEWENLGSSDQRALFVYQVRQGLPLLALADLLRQGQKAWDSLDENHREQLHLFAEALVITVDEKSNGRYRTAVE